MVTVDVCSDGGKHHWVCDSDGDVFTLSHCAKCMSQLEEDLTGKRFFSVDEITKRTEQTKDS
jgi:hypothetical protein